MGSGSRDDSGGSPGSENRPVSVDPGAEDARQATAPRDGARGKRGAGRRPSRRESEDTLPAAGVSGTERTLAVDEASQQTLAVAEGSEDTLPPSSAGAESAPASAGPARATGRSDGAGRDALTTGETVPGALVRGAGDLPELPAVDPAHYARGFEIARGGMGRVVVARDRRLGRTIAIKELIAGDRGLEARFEREVRITARLQHPSIITVHEAGRWPTGEPFYAMKHVEGRPLDRVIADQKSYAERLALLPNVIAVADALAYAHDQKVIHRDLKPANVLLGPFGETVVIDWGLAKDLEARSEASLSRRPESRGGGDLETVAGSVLGTPVYMSPEQARGDDVDQRTDVYAIGAILYTVLAGRPPYTGRDGSDALSAVLRGPPVRVAERLPAVAPDLAAIVDQAMAREPDDRYPDAGALVEDLKRFATGQLVSVHQYSAAALIKRWIGRHRAAVSVAAAAVVLMAVLGTLAITRIIDKERVARAQQQIAEEQRTVAQTQRELAERRADRITLLQARSALERDPTESLAWLEQVPIRDDDIADIRAIAERAVASGVARHVLRSKDRIEAVAISPSEETAAIGWSGGQVLLCDTRSGATRLLSGIGVIVLDLAFSADGQRLAGVVEDGSVLLWNLPAAEAVVIGKHSGVGRQVAFSRDDRWLASSAESPELLVWEVDGLARRSLDTGDAVVQWFEFSPAGDRLATAGADGRLQLWDVASGTGRVFASKLGRLSRVAFSPDGGRLASASLDDGVRVWPIEGGPGRRLDGSRGDAVDVVFSPGGNALLAAEKTGLLRYWDLATGRSRQLVGHKGEPSGPAGLFFGPQPDRAVSACVDGTVRVWDVTTGDSQVLLGHAPYIVSIVQSPRGLVVSGDNRGGARIWQPVAPASRLLGHNGSPAFPMAVAPDGHRVAFAGEHGAVRIVDLLSGDSRELLGHQGLVWWLAFSPDGRSLASVGDDRTARLWDVERGSSQVIYRHSSMLGKVVFSASGDHVAFRGVEDVVFVWSRADGQVRVLGDPEHPLYNMWFAPRGEVLACPRASGEIVLYDLAAGTETVLRGHPPGAMGIGFSANGKLLASCDTDGHARLWDAQTGTGRALASPCRGRFVPSFSPDGSLVAYAAPDNSLYVEETGSGRGQRLVGHQDRVYELLFFRSRSSLVSSSADGTIRVWDLEHGTSDVLVGHRRSAFHLASALRGAALISSGLDGEMRLWPDPLAQGVPTDPGALRRWIEATTTARVSPGNGAESPVALAPATGH